MFRIGSEIIETVCDYGGKYVGSMLDDEGVFDRPEMDFEFDSLDTWWAMMMEMNELRYAIKKRSPVRYSVPRHSEFLTILKVMDAASALCVQSVVVGGPDIQSQGNRVLARVILDTLRTRECDRTTGIAFLTAISQVINESEHLIHAIRVANQGRPSYDEVSALIAQHSKGPLAEVIVEDSQGSLVEAWQ